MRASPFACWLRLREGADGEARSTDLVERARALLGAVRPAVIHDLGCGTGSMGRWLAPRLPVAQHWVLYDQDPELLSRAGAGFPRESGGGAAVTMETRQRDVTRLGARGDGKQLHGATLVTASALLDLLTVDGLERLVAVCASAGCPVLITLSVTGSVHLTPEEALDTRIAAAFNDHQRRSTTSGHLLGPDAIKAAVEMFGEFGAHVLVRPSPWRLDATRLALTASWLTGWVDAAGEARPELRAETQGYLRRRLAALDAGQLAVTVHHADLLAVPA